MELFSNRGGRLDRPKQKAAVFVLNPKKYATDAWHNSTVVWLLGRSSCSSPSTKELRVAGGNCQVFKWSLLTHVRICLKLILRESTGCEPVRTADQSVWDPCYKTFMPCNCKLLLNSRPSIRFFLNGPFRASFSFIFVFSTNKYVKKCLSSIQCRDLNPRPSEQESLSITTRPGFLPARWVYT